MEKGIFTPSLLFRLLLPVFVLIGCANEETKNNYKNSTELAIISVAGAPIFDFGSQFVDSQTDNSFTLINIGNSTASNLNGSFSWSAYSFKGGTFPGTGGTCGTSLAPGDNCTIVVTFAPAYIGTFNEYLRVTYDNGAGSTNTTSPLINGRSIAAAAGSLDTTLDSDGKLIYQLGSGNASAAAVAVNTDNSFYLTGKVANAGQTDFFVTRHLSSGASDPSFAGVGGVAVDFNGGNDEAKTVLVQSSGKIVVAGWAMVAGSKRFAYTRLNTNGTLDTSFGNFGRANVAIGFGDAVLYGAALQSDGGIVSVGQGLNLDLDFVISRHTSNGNLDTNFNGTGSKSVSIGSSNDVGRAILVQPDSKIVAAGNTFNGSNDDMAAVRLNADGSLDTSFGANGKVVIDFGGNEQAWAMARQSDGKLVIGGSSNNSSTDFALVRLNEDGSIDNTFGTNGKVFSNVSSGNNEIKNLVIQSDGKIVAVGYAATAGDSDIAVARYLVDGNLDLGFSNTGVALNSLGSPNDFGFASSLQSNGKVVVAGETVNNGLTNIGVLRLWP